MAVLTIIAGLAITALSFFDIDITVTLPFLANCVLASTCLVPVAKSTGFDYHPLKPWTFFQWIYVRCMQDMFSTRVNDAKSTNGAEGPSLTDILTTEEHKVRDVLFDGC